MRAGPKWLSFIALPLIWQVLSMYSINAKLFDWRLPCMIPCQRSLQHKIEYWLDSHMRGISLWSYYLEQVHAAYYLSYDSYERDLLDETKYIISTCHMRGRAMKLSHFWACSHVKHTGWCYWYWEVSRIGDFLAQFLVSRLWNFGTSPSDVTYITGGVIWRVF